MAEETGLTFVENAIIKARHAASCNQDCPQSRTIPELEVDALDGRPGVHSARLCRARGRAMAKAMRDSSPSLPP